MRGSNFIGINSPIFIIIFYLLVYNDIPQFSGIVLTVSWMFRMEILKILAKQNLQYGCSSSSAPKAFCSCFSFFGPSIIGVSLSGPLKTCKFQNFGNFFQNIWSKICSTLTYYIDCIWGKPCGRKVLPTEQNHQDKLFCHKLDIFSPFFFSLLALGIFSPLQLFCLIMTTFQT